jgi:hypothetical protein
MFHYRFLAYMGIKERVNSFVRQGWIIAIISPYIHWLKSPDRLGYASLQGFSPP